MSGISSGNQTEQPNDNLSKAMKNLSVTAADNSDKSSSPKNLCDMPLDVVGLIIERSDYKEQLVLRKVSKSLRSLVDKQKPSCTRLEVSGNLSCIICKYNDRLVAYTSPKWAADLQYYEGYPFETTILRSDFKKAAFDDLASTLKNPKLQLETFLNDFEENDSFQKEDGHKNLEDVLKSINHQLSVRACKVGTYCFSNARSILSYFKPGVLNKFTVSQYETLESFKHISLLDQWKQAEELELECGFYSIPMEYATHFKRFHFYDSYIYDKRLVEMRDWLSKHDNFEYCFIEFWEHGVRCSAPRELCARVGQPAPPNKRTEYVSHYLIPNSDNYLEILFFETSIEIKKKKQLNSRP